jgi:hypothetical protein
MPSIRSSTDGRDLRDLRDLPFLDRKAALALLLRDTKAGILLNEHVDGDGLTVFEHACRLGAEGIVSKRVDGTYRSGPCPVWIKVRNPASIAVQLTSSSQIFWASSADFPLAARPPVIAMLKPILIGWPDCATALSVSTASVPTMAVVATPRLAACKNSRRFMIGPFAQATRTIWPPRRPQK